MDRILKELHFLTGLMDLLILAQVVNISCFHQIKTMKRERHQSFFSRMELPMKQVLIIFSLLIKAFSEDIENDIAYQQVVKELDGAVPDSFIREAFSHERLEIHKIIAERFAKPYEKKPWVEYKKILLKNQGLPLVLNFIKKIKF